MNAEAKKRGRPKGSKLKAAAEQMALEVNNAPVPPVEMRKEMRPPMREDDPRARAAQRAAEIRGHVGVMDEGTDEFFIPPEIVPEGWSYEWKRKTILGQEDPAYAVALARKGWEPVPANRHPSMMPDSGNFATIERKGMVLMERPLELTDEARQIELRRARAQVRQKEQQLNSAPAGTFDRNNKENSLVKVNKSFEAIPVPEK